MIPLAAVAFLIFTLYAFAVDIRVASWVKIKLIEREGTRCLFEVVREREDNLRMVDFRRADDGTAIVTVCYYGEIKEWKGSGTYWYEPECDLNRASDWMCEWLQQKTKEQP